MISNASAGRSTPTNSAFCCRRSCAASLFALRADFDDMPRLRATERPRAACVFQQRLVLPSVSRRAVGSFALSHHPRNSYWYSRLQYAELEGSRRQYFGIRSSGAGASESIRSVHRGRQDAVWNGTVKLMSHLRGGPTWQGDGMFGEFGREGRRWR